MTEKFKNITIRGRFAFAICCLESSINHLDEKRMDWSPLLELFWRYPTVPDLKGLADWFEQEGECIAFCIMDEVGYEKSDFEFVSPELYTTLKELYSNVDETIWKLTDLIHAIGTQYLYSGVRDGAPETLKYMEEVITLLQEKEIEIPSYSYFEQYIFPNNPITDWVVWGESIPLNNLSPVSSWIREKKNH